MTTEQIQGNASQVSAHLAELLELTRPLTFIDIETTGYSREESRIVEIAMVRLYPDGTDRAVRLVLNPEKAIHPQASQVHGLYWEDVKDQPTFPELAPLVAATLWEADLAGHNARVFDIPILQNELARCGIPLASPLHTPRVLDTLSLSRRDNVRNRTKLPRKLNAALECYCGPDVAAAHAQEAHQALSDVFACMHILAAQLTANGDSFGVLFEELYVPDGKPKKAKEKNSRPSHWLDDRGILIMDNGVVSFNVGKYTGFALDALVKRDPNYLRWAMQQTFPAEALDLIRIALEQA